MSGGTEYAEALVRAEAEIARLRRELERRAGAASPAPRDGACATCGRDLTCGSCRWFPGQPGGLCRLPDARPHLIDRETPACVAYEARAAPRDEDGAREALRTLATTWESKAIWLRTECASGVGAQARANVYNECADALRTLAPRGDEPRNTGCATPGCNTSIYTSRPDPVRCSSCDPPGLDVPPDGTPVGYRHNPERAHPCDFGCGGTWVCTRCGWESTDDRAATRHACPLPAPPSPPSGPDNGSNDRKG